MRGAAALALLVGIACADGSSASHDALPRLRLVEDGVLAAPDTLPLSGIRQIAVDTDGGLAVLDRQTPAVLLFDAEGRFEGSVGREGEGPGEFTSLFRVGRRGDVAWGVDARQRLVNVFRAGELVETLRPQGDAASAVPVMLTDGGTLLLARSQDSTIHMLYDDPADSTPPHFTVVDARDRMWAVGGGTSSLNQPFASYPLTATWARGLVVVRREASDPGSPAYEVEWWGLERLEHEVVVPYRAEPLTEDHIRTALDAIRRSSLPEMFVRTGRYASEDEVVAAAREALVLPATLPPIPGGASGFEAGSVRVSPDGTVWLERWTEEGDATWDVVDHGGPRARVTVPAGVRLMAVGASHAWGVTVDELNVPTVVRYRIDEEGS